MSEENAVLAANEAFYRAFAHRDVREMDKIWALETPVACIHPGWGALIGRGPVMQSWAAILNAPQAPGIRCQGARAFLQQGRSAFVVCHEILEAGTLLATNCFVKEEAGWRMTHHHASPARDIGREARPSGALH